MCVHIERDIYIDIERDIDIDNNNNNNINNNNNNIFVFAGQTHGKHREGEDHERPSPSHSKRGSRTSRGSSRETTPPNLIEALDREPRAGPPVREIVIETKEASSSPSHAAAHKTKSPKKPKSPTKGEKVKDRKGEVQEVLHVATQVTPVKQVKDEGSTVEPLTPLITDKPQATSTPSAPNGVISTGVQNGSPPMSTYILVFFLMIFLIITRLVHIKVLHPTWITSHSDYVQLDYVPLG